MFNEQKKKKGFLAGAFELIGLLFVVFVIRTVGFGLYQVPTGSMETTMLIGERFFADKFTYNFIRKPKRGDIIAFNDVMYKYSNNTFKRFIEEYVWGPSNVTKRIIGEPGDVIKGVVEDGKPVVYVNDKKLDEPYINKYPLLRVYQEDPKELIKKINQQLRDSFSWAHAYSIAELRERRLLMYTLFRSYDPNVSYQDQPFYYINPDRVFKTDDGRIDLLEPGQPSPQMQPRVTRGVSYWDGSDNYYVELADDEYWCMGDNRLGSKDCRSFGPVKANLIHGRIVFRIWSLDSYESWFILDLIKHPIDFWNRVRWSRCLQMVH